MNAEYLFGSSNMCGVLSVQDFVALATLFSFCACTMHAPKIPKTLDITVVSNVAM